MDDMPHRIGSSGANRLDTCLVVAASLLAGLLTLTSGRPKFDERWHRMQAQLFATGDLRQLRYSDELRQQFLGEIRRRRPDISEDELQRVIPPTVPRSWLRQQAATRVEQIQLA